MKKRPERLRLLSAALLATVVLLTPGCSIWQVGDVAPDYVDASTHRGVDVLAFDAESRTLASGGWDGKIGVWTLGNEKPEQVWLGHDGSVQGLSYSGGQLISGGQDGRLVVWSGRGKARRSVDTGSSITHVRTLNELVITGHYDGSVRAWALPALDNVMRLDLHGNDPVAALAIDLPSNTAAAETGVL